MGDVPWASELSTGQGLLPGHLPALSSPQADVTVPCASFSSCNMEKPLKPQPGSSPHVQLCNAALKGFGRVFKDRPKPHLGVLL